jgi:acyl carrier protein
LGKLQRWKVPALPATQKDGACRVAWPQERTWILQLPAGFYCHGKLGGHVEERKARIRVFLSTFFGNRDLGDSQDIFALGFVNSLLAIQLVSFLEKEFAITIEDQDLDFENFKTVNNMDALVERKRAGTLIPA